MKHLIHPKGKTGAATKLVLVAVLPVLAMLVAPLAAHAGAATPTVGGPEGRSVFSYRDLGDQAAKYEGGYAAFEDTAEDRYATSPHGGYDTATNKCSVCHAVHRADGSYYLLRADSQADACEYCHVGSGHSAKIVYDANTLGTQTQVGHRMGASPVIPASATSQATESVTVTSTDAAGEVTTSTLLVRVVTPPNRMFRLQLKHTQNAAGEGRSGYMRVGPVALSCMSCHQPHNAPEQLWQPRSFATRQRMTGGYKMLRGSPSGSIQGPDGMFYDTVGDTTRTVSYSRDGMKGYQSYTDYATTGLVNAGNVVRAPESDLTSGTFGPGKTVWDSPAWPGSDGEITATSTVAVDQYALSVWCADCHNLAVGSFDHGPNAAARGTSAHEAAMTHKMPFTGAANGPGQCYTCHRGDLSSAPASAAIDASKAACERCHYGTGSFAVDPARLSGAADWPHSAEASSAYMLGAWTTGPDGSIEPTAVTAANAKSVVCDRCHAGAIKIEKSADATGYASAGQRITYTYRVTNAGGNPVYGPFAVFDNRLTVNAPSTPSLEPSASLVATASYVVTQADLDGGSITNTATATAENKGTRLTSNTASLTIGAVQMPSIGLEKTGVYHDTNGSGRQDAGDTVTYAFALTNTGNVTLSGVSVTDAKVGVVGSTLATLSPSVTASGTFSASYTLTQGDIDAGTLENVATATATFRGATYTGSDEDTRTLEQLPSLSLVKAATYQDSNGNGRQDAGDTIAYAFTVTNTGNVTLTNVAVTDPKATVAGSAVATLAPGATDSSFSASYVLTQPDVDAGNVDGTATVSADFKGTPCSAEGGAVVTVEQRPSLALEKRGTYADSNGNGRQDAGDQVLYGFTVTNTGNTTLYDVRVEDAKAPVPAASVRLGPGETDASSFAATYTITQADVDAGGLENSATATASFGGVTHAAAASHVLPLARSGGLALSKVGVYRDANGDGLQNAGDAIDYAFSVTNTGNVTLANVMVSDPLVPVVALPVWLAPGETDTTSFFATYTLAQADIDAGTLTNAATATGDGGTTQPTASDSDTQTFTHVSALSLTTRPSTLVYEGAGEMITYTYTLRNAGNVPISGPFTVADDRLAVSLPPVDSLAPSASVVGTAAYLTSQAEVDGGSITNHSYAIADNGGVPVTSNTETVTVAALQAPAVSLTQSGLYRDTNGDGVQNAGDTIDYSFAIANTGNVTLRDITLSDPTQALSGTGLPSLLPGSVDSTSFTATHLLTQDDIDGGSYTNTATASGTFDGRSYADSDVDVRTFERTPILALEATAAPSVYLRGDTILYSYTVRNAGNVTLTGPFTISDDRVAVAFPPTVALAPAQSFEASAAYTAAQADVDRGSITSHSYAAAANGGEPVPSTTATVTVTADQRGSIELDKIGAYQDTNGDGVQNAGDSMIYSFTVANTGNVTLAGVIVTDPKITLAGAPVWLAPGEVDSSTFSGTYTLDQRDIDEGVLDNTATAHGWLGQTEYTDSDSHTQTFTQQPALYVEHAGTLADTNSSGKQDAGDTITYTFVVSNTGNVTLTGIGVSDEKATVTGGPIWLGPGSSDPYTFTATYTVTTADIEAGSVENTAAATGTFRGTQYTGNVSHTLTFDTHQATLGSEGITGSFAADFTKDPIEQQTYAGQPCSDCHLADLKAEHAKSSSSSEGAGCLACHPAPRDTFTDWTRSCSQGGCHATYHDGIESKHAVPDSSACTGCHPAWSGMQAAAVHNDAWRTRTADPDPAHHPYVGAGEIPSNGCRLCHVSPLAVPTKLTCSECHQPHQ